MRLDFKDISIQNFMSFEDETFDFSGNNGLNLICGKNNDVVGGRNGAGKSNLINALIFALFGKTIHNINNKNIPNRFVPSDRNTEVILNFDADGVPYRITSGLKGKKASGYCILEQMDLPEDKRDKSKSKMALTRKYIEEEILHCNFELFLRSIVLTSDQSYNFFKLEKGDKRKFIEQIFDLGIFGVMFAIVHRDLLDTNSEYGKTEREYAVIDNQLEKLKENQKNHIESKKNDLNELVRKLKNLKTEYDLLRESMPETVDDFEERERELLSKKSKIVDKISEIKDKRHEVEKSKQEFIGKHSEEMHKKEKEVQDIRYKIRNIKTDMKHIKSKIDTTNKHIKTHEDLYESLCSECKPKFDERFSIEENRDRVTESTREIKDYKVEAEALLAEITKLNSQIEDTSDIDTGAYDTRLKKIDDALAKLSTGLKKVKEAQQEFNELRTVNSQIERDRNKLNEMSSIIKTERGNVDTLKAEIESNETPFDQMLEETKESFKKVQSDLADLKEKIAYIRMVEMIVSEENLRKIIIKDLVHLLNNQISIYLNRMGSKFNCVFDENLFYTFHTESGDTEYANFSSGEKMRLSIATSFAFRDFMANRSGIESNILILDEYMDSNLDKKAIKELMNILTEFNVKHKQDIYIVSHRSELDDDQFNRIITVEKTDGISEIKTQEMEG